MPSRLTTVADAVKAVINDAALPGAPVATRVFIPSYDTTKQKLMQINVVPGTDRNRELLTREEWSDQVVVHVAVYLKLAATDGTTEASNAEIDSVIGMAEAIYDLFAPGGHEFGEYSLRSPDSPPTYIPEWLKEKQCAVSIFQLTFTNP